MRSSVRLSSDVITVLLRYDHQSTTPFWKQLTTATTTASSWCSSASRRSLASRPVPGTAPTDMRALRCVRRTGGSGLLNALRSGSQLRTDAEPATGRRVLSAEGRDCVARPDGGLPTEAGCVSRTPLAGCHTRKMLISNRARAVVGLTFAVASLVGCIAPELEVIGDTSRRRSVKGTVRC